MDAERIRRRRRGAVSLELDLEAGDNIQAIISRPNGLFFVTEQKIIRVRSDDDLDPDATEADAPWAQSIHLPHGSRDELVARTILQSKALAEAFFGLQDTRSNQLLDISWEVMNSLVCLRHMRVRLGTEIERLVSAIENDIERYTSGKSPPPLPLIPYFDIEFRSYINEVRRTLTKVSEVFSVFTDYNCENGHFHKALEWAEKHLGEDQVLSQMLRNDLKWLKIWIDIRIAIEHPKVDRYLETANFSLLPNRQIQLPTWRFMHPDYPSLSRPQVLIDALKIVEANILKFYEDLQVALLEPRTIGPYVLGAALIDESERDELAPMRYAFGPLAPKHRA